MYFILFWFLQLQPEHMEVPVLGVELELQLPAYTTATTTWNPSCICDLHHSSQQSQIFNPLSGARDQTYILMDISWVHYHSGNSRMCILAEDMKNSIVFSFLFYFIFTFLAVSTAYGSFWARDQI